MISLGVATAYLMKEKKPLRAILLTALPATFLSAVSMTYILSASEGFRIPTTVSYPVGLVFAAALFLFFLYKERKTRHTLANCRAS